MSREIQISFTDLETTATISLLEDVAPNASGLIWGILQTPVTTRAVHAIYAGPAVLIDIPERHGEPRGGTVPVENETQHPRPGDVLVLPPADDPEEDLWGEPGREAGVTIAIFYGRQGRPFSPSGWQPGVVIGRVTGGVEAVKQIGRATRFAGAQPVCIAREGCPGEVERAIMHSDGASLGNPGPAGAGYVITSPDGRVLGEGAIPLEPNTVNVAEYRGLIDGLLEAQRLGVRRLHAKMDSQLIVRQLSGEYRVKAENLRPLYQWASKLISGFDEFTCEHVPRDENKRADELAGEAAKRSKEQHGRK